MKEVAGIKYIRAKFGHSILNIDTEDKKESTIGMGT